MKIKNILVGISIGAMLLFAACNKQPTNQGPQITLVEIANDAVKAHFDENFIISQKCDYIARATYYVPTVEWVQQKLIPAWFDFRSKNNIMYDPNTDNCQDFSLYCHLAAQGIEKNRGVAVGVFFYVRDIDNKAHAINIILINDGQKINVALFEPQTNQFVQLSKTEIASCIYWYI